MRAASNKTTLKQRILILCDFLEISPNALSELAGKGRNYVSNMKDYMGSDVLLSIWKNYPDISIEWILSGKGKMLHSEKDVFVDAEDLKSELKNLQDLCLLQKNEIEKLRKRNSYLEKHFVE